MENFNKYPKLLNLNDKNTQITVSFLFISIGLILFLSFSSFYINWKTDYDLINMSYYDFFSNDEIKINGFLGKIGIILGHIFIYKFFGFASFFIPIFIFIFSFKTILNLQNIQLSRIFKTIIFFSLWLILFFGTLFPKKILLSGIGGEIISNWFLIQIGKIGIFIVLIFSLIIFFSIYFKWTPDSLAPALKNFFSFFRKLKLKTINHEKKSINVSDIVRSIAISKEKLFNDFDEFNNQEISNYDGKLNYNSIESDNEKNDEIKLDIEIKNDEKNDEKNTKYSKNEIGPYDPTLDLKNYKFPLLNLMIDYPNSSLTINKEELEENKNQIVNTLNNYKIEISKIKATVGPTVTLYEIIPAPGVRISKIKGLENDIALSLAALGIRIIAPLPGKGTIGIEVPNSNPSIVSMKSILASEKFKNSKFELAIALGKTISNETYVVDLSKMPHLLMAGATGQGKSVGLNAILASLLYKKHPSQIKFILVDPKKVELTLYNNIEKHFLAKLPNSDESIITDTSKVVNTLNSLCIEMDNRYDLLKKAQVRNIKEYNEKFTQRRLNPNNGHRFLPYIILVIDEFADLIMTAGKEIETPIARLAQLARAIGIHLIIATQRPSTNIITGTIKANFPTRIAFRVSSVIDSRTILDSSGANQLIGRGDMLISDSNNITRLQCAFIDTQEVEKLTNFIGNQIGYSSIFELPEYESENNNINSNDVDIDDRDILFKEAANIIVIHQQGSASLLQRKLKLGYNRAGRIIDQLEAANIIGPYEGSRPRQVLIQDEISLNKLLDNMND